MPKIKHNRNDNYFSEPNLENSYWAGFIAADGCVTKENSLRIQLSLKDLEHLKKFSCSIEWGGKLREYQRENKSGTISYMCSVDISSKQICEDLKNNFNIIPNKTYVGIPPDLEGDFKYSFLIGYIDGDGCIRKRSQHKKYKYESTVLQLTCHNDEYRDWLADILKEISGAEPVRYKINLTLNGKNADKVLEFLDKFEVPRLERKWDKSKRASITQRSEYKIGDPIRRDCESILKAQLYFNVFCEWFYGKPQKQVANKFNVAHRSVYWMAKEFEKKLCVNI